MTQVATVWTANAGIDGQGSDMLEVQAVVTGDDGNGAVAIEPLKGPAGNILNLAGYYLYQVCSYFGSPPPTVNSDLELLEHTSTGKDVLLGAGLNNIDAATDNVFQPYLTGTTPGKIPIYGPLYMKVTGNTDVSGKFTLVFKFAKS